MSRNNNHLIVAAHQSHYLPWLGYLDKLNKVDYFCLVDTLVFEPEKVQHQNKIRTNEGEKLLTIPVITQSGKDALIKDVLIDNTTQWGNEHWEAIKGSYSKAPYFNEYKDFFEEVYTRKWEKLVDINAFMIQGLLDFFCIDTKLLHSSSVQIKEGENLLVAVSNKVGAKVYMSGAGGNCSQLEEDALHNAGIKHVVQKFDHPEYPQIHGEFVPKMATIDLLFNCGKEGLLYLKK